MGVDAGRRTDREGTLPPANPASQRGAGIPPEASRAGKNAALILQLGPHKIIMMPLAEAIERVGDL
jgi:hypothetical protein